MIEEAPLTENRAGLLAAYAEICRSYHAIDEFRMKLLGFLPLASLVAVFVLDTETVSNLTTSPMGVDLLRFGALFAAMLTLALFGYEIRGIVRTHNLITEGAHLESLLRIGHGQFHVCAEEHANQLVITRALNTKAVACVIYSLVFSGWLFLALRLGFDIQARTCAAWAAGLGLMVASVMYVSIRKLISP
jgi:hypothetical protein